MSKDVFVSYAGTDRSVADRVCAYLEGSGVRCWIAPRDILPGSDWSTAIIEGLTDVSVVVLVHSSAARASKHIPREVERADSKGKIVIPLMIDDVPPTGSLEYYLGPTQCIQAFDGPIEDHFSRLLDVVRKSLDQVSSATTDLPAAVPDSAGDDDLVALARSVCRNLHEELRSPERSPEVGTTISEPKHGQVVRVIDALCNKLARETVTRWSHRHRREVLLVGEDLAPLSPGPDRPPVICCLDSLDGTEHWLHSRNLYCTALSLFARGPSTDDPYDLRVSAVQTADGAIFIAREDAEATYVDDGTAPVRVPASTIDVPAKAQVCTVARRPAHYRILARLLSDPSPFQGLYTYGGNPMLCELALGRYDAVFQPDASSIGDNQEIWDWLPGGHVFSRAGGHLLDLRGQPIDVRREARSALEAGKTDFPFVAAANLALGRAIVEWLRGD